MTLEELAGMLEETGFPFAYDHFAEGESPDPPFICYLLPGSDNFSADGRVYPSIPDNPEDWLDEFNTFNIYQVLPKLIELWGMNIRTDVEAKKNFMQQTVK